MEILVNSSGKVLDVRDKEKIELQPKGTLATKLFKKAFFESNVQSFIDKMISTSSIINNIKEGMKEVEELIVIIPPDIEEGIKKGIYEYMNNTQEDGVVKAVIRDAVSKKIVSIPDIKIEKTCQGINQEEMFSSIQSASMQDMIREISEKMEYISENLDFVLQGMENDRIALYYSAEKQYKDACLIQDEHLKKYMIASSIKTLTDSISMMEESASASINKLSSKYNPSNHRMNMKQSLVDEQIVGINTAFDVINKAYYLKAGIYYANNEIKAMEETFTDYGLFLEKALSEEHVNMLYTYDVADTQNIGGTWYNRSKELPNKIKEFKAACIENKFSYSIEEIGER